AATYLRYRFSETTRIRRQVAAIEADIEETLAAYQANTEQRRVETETAAKAYVETTRRHCLSGVTLDDIRKLAPGARMQPLRDMGVNSLLDCHAWTTGNFLALRGIGADSATRLAAACAALKRSVNQQPIPH